MFDRFYCTVGVNAGIPTEIQLLCWQMLKELHNSKKADESIDYLHVFTLSKGSTSGETTQKIVHKTEYPDYQGVSIFEVENPIEATVWIMDSGNGNAVMLFPNDY